MGEETIEYEREVSTTERETETFKYCDSCGVTDDDVELVTLTSNPMVDHKHDVEYHRSGEILVGDMVFHSKMSRDGQMTGMFSKSDVKHMIGRSRQAEIESEAEIVACKGCLSEHFLEDAVRPLWTHPDASESDDSDESDPLDPTLRPFKLIGRALSWPWRRFKRSKLYGPMEATGFTIYGLIPVAGPLAALVWVYLGGDNLIEEDRLIFWVSIVAHIVYATLLLL